MTEASRHRSYGRQIVGPGLLDFAPRLKSRIVARFQDPILDAFGRLTPGTTAARVFARLARAGVGAFLYSLKLEINNRCSMNCRICYVPRGDREISVETLAGIFRSIGSHGVRIEILGGEPLLHPELVRIIEGAKQIARSPFITLYTNGTLATPEASAAMKKAGLDAAIVSLLSFRPEIHDACTDRPGSWADTVKGIGHLTGAGLKVYTFTPVLRLNIGDLPGIYDFIRDTLRAAPLFYQYIPRSAGDPWNISPEEWQAAKHWILGRGSEHWRFVRNFYMLTGNSCSGGNFVLTVKSDGSVQPCPFVDDAAIGNIYEQDIWTIYRRRFRRPSLGEFKALPTECRGCSHQSVCGGGCRAAARWFGGYGRRDPKCLGPYSGPVTAAGVLDCVPTFF